MITTLFSVSISDDKILENNETLELAINSSSLPDKITVGTPGQATVTIVDNDGMYKQTIMISIFVEHKTEIL